MPTILKPKGRLDMIMVSVEIFSFTKLIFKEMNLKKT